VERDWDDGQGADVKTETPHADEAVWAYLHGELDDAARLEFDLRLATDRDLSQRTARARRLDLMLRASLPTLDATDLSDARLTDQALAAWARDQAVCATPQVQADTSPLSGKKRTWFARPAAVGLIGLAAAALLIVVAHPVFLTPREPRWAPPAFSPLVFRGAAAAPQMDALDARAVQKAQAALAAAFTRAIASRGGALPPGLTLSLQMRELRDGAFSVSVQARLPDGTTLGEWSGDYSSLERFLAHVDISAARLAETLAASPGEANTPRIGFGE
jgi:hypothetical protein